MAQFKVPWTQDEIELLREVYPTKGSGGYQEASLNKFSYRTADSIKCKAYSLGLKLSNKRQPFQWTNTFLQLLYKYYPEGGVKEVVNQFRRRKLPVPTANSVISAANRRGLTKNNFSHWSLKELEIVEAYYWREGREMVRRRLKEAGYIRTKHAIQQQAFRMGLRRWENPYE